MSEVGGSLRGRRFDVVGRFDVLGLRVPPRITGIGGGPDGQLCRPRPRRRARTSAPAPLNRNAAAVPSTAGVSS